MDFLKPVEKEDDSHISVAYSTFFSVVLTGSSHT
jgi:hypothetical protein